MTGLILLLVVLGCTVGETPPESPPPGPTVSQPEEGIEAGDPGPAPMAGDDARAEALLDSARVAYEGVELELALSTAQEVLSRHGRTAAAVEAQWIAAQAAFGLGRYQEARQLARAYAEDQPSGSEAAEEARDLAQLAEDAMASGESAPAVIGAVLPRTGSRVLVRYGDLLLEGIELAVAEAERTLGRRVELIVADDEGGLRTREAVNELERRGALAIVGPMLPQQLASAARARSSSQLVLVSPTAPATPRQWSQLYSISAGDARGAEELGWYAADAGLRQATILHQGTPEYRRKAEAFAEAFRRAGGAVRVSVPYDSGTTTFESHLEQVLDAVGVPTGAGQRTLGQRVYGDTAAGAPVAGQPFALFVAAPEGDVPKIAPQISFYGLDTLGVQVFGDEAWASAGVRRVVPDRDLQGVVATSYFPPEWSDAVSDPQFVRLYEDRYRRSLTNPLPALGYDAAHLLVQALPNRRMSPAALARRFELLSGIRGATGLLSVRSDRIVRTPYIVLIRDGGLVPAPPPWSLGLPADSMGVGRGGG